MSYSTKRRKQHAQARREPGSFVALPRCVLTSRKFIELSPHAAKLLLDLCAQLNQSNNGQLSPAWALMKKRNWKSKATLNKVRKELIEKGFISITRQGSLHQCSLYALTFFAIDPSEKMDAKPTSRPTSEWRN